MGRYGDNSGVENTCPIIDEVRDFIESIEWDESEADLKAGAIAAATRLETIRSMNLNLRKWGNKQYNIAEEHEKEIDQLKKQIDALEYDNKQKDSEIERLENQLSEVEV